MAAKKAGAKSSKGASKAPVTKAQSASRTPAWVRVVIIVLVVAFLGTSVVFVVAGSRSQSTGDEIADTYQPQLDNALASLESSPTDAQLDADVADVYFNWARDLTLAERQTDAARYWDAAVDYYNRALEVVPDSPDLLWRKAFALYYAGDSDAAAALATFIASSKESTALAEQVKTAKDMLDALTSPSATSTAP